LTDHCYHPPEDSSSSKINSNINNNIHIKKNSSISDRNNNISINSLSQQQRQEKVQKNVSKHAHVHKHIRSRAHSQHMYRTHPAERRDHMFTGNSATQQAAAAGGSQGELVAGMAACAPSDWNTFKLGTIRAPAHSRQI
jgi:hypothetical protein